MVIRTEIGLEIRGLRRAKNYLEILYYFGPIIDICKRFSRRFVDYFPYLVELAQKLDQIITDDSEVREAFVKSVEDM